MKKTIFNNVKLIFISAIVIVTFTAFAANTMAAGKKYALFVGINDYPGTENDLNGAVNDAKNFKNLLTTKFHYPAANTTILLDSAATRENIISQIAAYGALAGSGDILVFQYSGHGTLFPDIYSDVIDETKKVSVDIPMQDGSRYQLPLDYYDSAIVPWDADDKSSSRTWQNLILDDELYDMFSKITAKGATVVFVSDSCHSGSVGKAQLMKYRYMPTEKALGLKSLSDLKKPDASKQMKAATPIFNNRYIVLSAARDDEVAWDGNDSAIPGGLFTSTLIGKINASKVPLTYGNLLPLVAAKMAAENQHPQLDRRFGNVNANLFEPIM
jgi:uncharacterized caspase-like protein